MDLGLSIDALTPLDWPLFFIHLFYFIPIYILIKYYKKTKIFDYLLFSIFLGFLVIEQFAEIFFLIELWPSQELWFFVNQISISMFLLVLLLHAVRLKWEGPPMFLIVSLLLIPIMSILNALIVVPEYIDLLIGTGLQSLIPLIRELPKYIGLVSTFAFILVYASTKPVVKDRRANTARILWLIVGFSWCIDFILKLVAFNFFIEIFLLVQLKRLFTSLVAIFITVRYPEAVLISQPQIIRAVDLYQSIKSLNTEQAIQNFGMASLIDYINQIPAELKNR